MAAGCKVTKHGAGAESAINCARYSLIHLSVRKANLCTVSFFYYRLRGSAALL